MERDGLPCLNLLEATPDILRGLMCELSEEDARWKPAPDRFSVAEVLAHLSHSEWHCYRMRLRGISDSSVAARCARRPFYRPMATLRPLTETASATKSPAPTGRWRPRRRGMQWLVVRRTRPRPCSRTSPSTPET